MTIDEQKRMTETPRFMAQEVAYRIPGEAWKRKTVKTASAFDRLIAKLDEDGAEVLTRDADDTD